MSVWQPMETAPRDEEITILAGNFDTESFAAVCFYKKHIDDAPLWWTLDGMGYMTGFFTHWMPIPPKLHRNSRRVSRCQSNEVNCTYEHCPRWREGKIINDAHCALDRIFDEEDDN